MLLYKISFVLWLSLLCAFFTVYPKFVLYFMTHPNAMHFYQFCMCYQNIFNYKQRPLWRNIIFNLLRNFTPWALNFQFLDVIYTQEQIMANVVELIAFSIFVQYFFPKKWIDDNRML